MIVRTIGFVSEISEEKQAKIMQYALMRINSKTDFIVLDPETKENYQEDQGRTWHCVNPWTAKKIYVKLDDYGEPEKWSEMYEPKVVEELKKAPNCRFVVTFMFAEEY